MPDIELPLTPDGNDPADYDESTLDSLDRQIDEIHRRERVETSMASSQCELAQMARYLDLCREFEARLGRKLTDPKSVAHRSQCEQALRSAGKL